MIAAIVAPNILCMGDNIATDSMRDAGSGGQPPISNIRGVIETNGHGALEAHDISTRQAGRALFIEFISSYPGSMTVDEAHVICDRLESSIERTIEGSEVVIHVEPEYKAKRDELGWVLLEQAMPGLCVAG